MFWCGPSAGTAGSAETAAIQSSVVTLYEISIGGDLPVGMDPHAVSHQQGHPWRQELFFKTQAQLHAMLPFLRTSRPTIRGVNVPNKSPDDPLLDSVRDLVSAGIRDVCVHYSIKNQPPLSPDPVNAGRRRRADSAAAAVVAGSARLSAFMQELESVTTGTTNVELSTRVAAGHSTGGGDSGGGDISILLVSGGGKKKAFNSLSALQEMQRARQKAASTDGGALLNTALVSNEPDVENAGTVASVAVVVGTKRRALEQPPQRPVCADAASTAGSATRAPLLLGPGPRDGPSPHPRIFVAFNPYLPDADYLAVEYTRLEQKLATGIPSGIYLQVRQERS